MLKQASVSFALLGQRRFASKIGIPRKVFAEPFLDAAGDLSNFSSKGTPPTPLNDGFVSDANLCNYKCTYIAAADQVRFHFHCCYPWACTHMSHIGPELKTVFVYLQFTLQIEADIA